MKVLKFGGSTLSGIERIQRVLQLINIRYDSEQDIILVFSAFGGMTDRLIKMSEIAAQNRPDYQQLLTEFEKHHLEVIKTLIPGKIQSKALKDVNECLLALKDTLHGVHLVRELSVKTLDFILSFGERLSATIMLHCLNARSINAELKDYRRLIVTDNQFGNARVQWMTTIQNIMDQLSDRKNIPIIPGFIGTSVKSEITTLGRGGSDYTATLIGAALNAELVEIWTHVDGILTADPGKVSKAFPIDRLSWDEAMELSHFGTKLIFPPAMIPAAAHNIPLVIRNIMNPDFPGTTISRSSDSDQAVRGISSIDKIALLRVQGSGMMGVVGIANRLFSALAQKSVNVILITQASSEHSICFAVAPSQADIAKEAIEEQFALEISSGRMEPVIVETDTSIVAIVGENMRQTPGISSRLFQSLGKNGVNVRAIAQGSSELNISVVISKTDETKALNALHESFFLSDTKSLHIFLIGTGLIGSTLLKQIASQQEKLQKNNFLDIRVMGIGNIEKMLISGHPLPVKNWKTKLGHAESMNIDRYLEQMLSMNLSNTVFVDCTGSANIVDHYERILDATISIVTPNKIANSGPYPRYKRLREKATSKGVKFLYETNVGAGLPVISTLNDLICSGDQIVKIEAVLSGTLSYIFNSFIGDKNFSEIVREAQIRGLSEPDPRDDLNGLDVARKLLILSREIGLQFELDELTIENILPESCRNAKDVPSFFKELEKADAVFMSRRFEAEKQNKVLRYIASLENGKATVSLKSVDNRHPFYSLSGSDNMIVFTTERYKELPLVIKGPGAGAEVTAAGVFADIIRIANYLS
jgi:aspartokinase/homoserine dehydrogenase 1